MSARVTPRRKGRMTLQQIQSIQLERQARGLESHEREHGWQRAVSAIEARLDTLEIRLDALQKPQ